MSQESAVDGSMEMEEPDSHPLARNGRLFDSIGLTTGYRGARGERVKHTAHKGALYLPEEVLDGFKLSNTLDPVALPTMDAVQRPTVSQSPVILTHLVNRRMQRPDGTQFIQTVAQNRSITTERVRGGGEEEQPSDRQAAAMKSLAAAAAAAAGALSGQTPPTINPVPGTASASSGVQPVQATDVAAASTPVATPSSANPAAVQPAPTKSGETTVPQSPASAPVAQQVSSSQIKAKVAPPKIIPLAKVPAPQYEQHISNPANAASTLASSTLPLESVTDDERLHLPEWFNQSAPHRTEATYLKTRNQIMRMGQQLKPRTVTVSMVRRVIAGDAGSLLRLHGYLTTNKHINTSNESTPRALVHVSKVKWTDVTMERLVHSVVQHAGESDSVDWDAVAKDVGNGVSSTECQQQFLTMPNLQQQSEDRPVTPDVAASSNQWIKDLVASTKPSVLSAATEAAFAATNDVNEVRSAVVTAAATVQQTGSIQDILNQRMTRLEARMSMLDEVEALLETERVALELERRDLYTSRCRHWFQG